MLARIIGLCLLVALLAVSCGGGGSDPYVQANEQLLDTLSALPGAKRIETTSEPYYHGVSDEPLGYTTTAVYAPPEGATPRDVLEFYTLQLMEEWSYRSRQLGAGEDVALVAEFTQGNATISITTEGMSDDAPTYRVAVDYGGER